MDHQEVKQKSQANVEDSLLKIHESKYCNQNRNHLDNELHMLYSMKSGFSANLIEKG